MPYFHATLSFSYLQDFGWVEQFYRSDADRVPALAAAVALAQARFSILGAGSTCTRVRVCQVGLPRACLSAGIAGNALALPSTLPLEALDVKLTSLASTQHWRNYPLRGLPIAWFQRIGTRWLLNPAFRPRVDAWLQLLVTGRWLLQVEQALAPVQPLISLQQVAVMDGDIYADPLTPQAPEVANTVIAAYAVNALPLNGEFVHIHGAIPSPNTAKLRRLVNGTHPIILTQGNSVRFFGNFGGALEYNGGTVEVRSLAYLPISDWNYVRRVGRKCGPYKEPGDAPEVTAPPLPALPVVRQPVARAVPLNTASLPAINTYRTLQDIAKEIFKGYTEPTTPRDPLIGIAQLANTVSLEYAVFLGGVDLHIFSPSWEQYADALSSLFGTPDQYTSSVRATVEANTEDGCGLHIFGHSAGGMSAQWISGLYPSLGRRVVKTLVGFGCPWIVSSKSFLEIPHYGLFMVRADPVPYLGPGGWAVPVRAWLAFYSRGESEVAGDLFQQAIPLGQTVLDGDDLPINDLIARHNCYPTLPDCLNYWWDGTPVASTPGSLKQPLFTSIVRRFLYPP